jgi:hypothetical protein
MLRSSALLTLCPCINNEILPDLLVPPFYLIFDVRANPHKFLCLLLANLQLGLIQAPDHPTKNLQNLIERISNGSMPKVNEARVFIKQILRDYQDSKDLIRVLTKWDKRL